MKTYAYIANGLVWEIIAPRTDDLGNEIPLSDRYTPEFCSSCADISSITPAPLSGWTATEANGAWNFTAPAQTK